MTELRKTAYPNGDVVMEGKLDGKKLFHEAVTLFADLFNPMKLDSKKQRRWKMRHFVWAYKKAARKPMLIKKRRYQIKRFF